MPTFTLHFSNKEARLLRAKARTAGERSIAAYLRRLALVYLNDRSREFIKDDLTGLMVDVTPGPRVTAEQVRRALRGFP